MKFRIKKLAVILIFAMMSLKSFAHPHIWAYTDLNLLTKDTKITGLGVKWAFDTMYSSAFMMDNDLNKDGKLDEEEQSIIQDHVMKNAVARLRPFIMLYFNGVKDTDYKFKNLKITYDEQKEQIMYNFKIILTQPQSLAGQHKLAILDEEYYVGFEQSYDLKIPNNCSFELEEDETMSVYDGLINPEVYKLNCK